MLNNLIKINKSKSILALQLILSKEDPYEYQDILKVFQIDEISDVSKEPFTRSIFSNEKVHHHIHQENKY